MKKLLGSTLALALLLPAGANAELFKNLQVGGSLDVEGVDGNNLTDFNTKKYDELNSVLTRLNVKADWDVLDDVHAHIGLDKYDAAWGANADNAYNTSGYAWPYSVQNNNSPTHLNTASNPSQGLVNALNSFLIDEAYVKVKNMFGAVDMTVGRQFYGEQGDLVAYYGPHQTYGLDVDALDAVRLDWQGDKFGVTVIGSKLYAANQQDFTLGNYYGYGQNGNQVFNPGATNTGDQTLWGIVADAKPTDNTKGVLALYMRDTVNSGNGDYYNANTDETSANNNGVQADDLLYVLDIKGKVTAAGAWLKAEVAKDFGQYRPGANQYYFGTQSPNNQQNDSNYSGWAVKLDAGDKLDTGFGAVTGWGQFAAGSGTKGTGSNAAAGEFQGVAGDYRPGDIYGRFFTNGNYAEYGNSGLTFNGAYTGNSSVGGLVVVGAGAKVSPAALSKLSAGVSWWNFRYQNRDTAAYYSGNNNHGNGFIGNEFDLDLTWQQSENVSVTVSGGTFQPGNYIKAVNASNGNGNNPATLLAADFHLKF